MQYVRFKECEKSFFYVNFVFGAHLRLGISLGGGAQKKTKKKQRKTDAIG
jgi:hypothetical protein